RIVREHGPMVYTTAWRILGQAADAEDVVQDVFMEVQRVRVHVRCWPALLRRLTTFRALDRLRQRKPNVGLDVLCLSTPKRVPEPNAKGRDGAERLRHARGHFTGRDVALVCMRYYVDLFNPRIGEQLSISSEPLAAAWQKARAKLENLLAEPV